LYLKVNFDRLKIDFLNALFAILLSLFEEVIGIFTFLNFKKQGRV